MHEQINSVALPGTKPPQRPGSIHPVKMPLKICLGSVHPLCTVARQTGADLACCRAVGKQGRLFKSTCTMFGFRHLELHIEADAGKTVLIEASSREI